MAEHNKLGRNGEDATADYLKLKGHRILERNWRFQKYEVDIISIDGEFIVFTEVKTRASIKWGYPEEFVDEHRMQRMIRAANIYLKMHQVDCPVRFDIVSVVWDKDRFEIEHIEDAFLAF